MEQIIPLTKEQAVEAGWGFESPPETVELDLLYMAEFFNVSAGGSRDLMNVVYLQPTGLLKIEFPLGAGAAILYVGNDNVPYIRLASPSAVLQISSSEAIITELIQDNSFAKDASVNGELVQPNVTWQGYAATISFSSSIGSFPLTYLKITKEGKVKYR